MIAMPPLTSFNQTGERAQIATWSIGHIALAALSHDVERVQ